MPTIKNVPDWLADRSRVNFPIGNRTNSRPNSEHRTNIRPTEGHRTNGNLTGGHKSEKKLTKGHRTNSKIGDENRKFDHLTRGKSKSPHKSKRSPIKHRKCICPCRHKSRKKKSF